MLNPNDGKPGNPGAASSPANTPNAETTQAGAEDQPGKGEEKRSEYVDRARFDEVNTRMKTAEQQSQNLTQAAQVLYGQMQHQAQRLAQLEQHQQAGQVDSEMETIKRPFVNGAADADAAEQAFDAVYKTADYATKKALKGFKDEMIGELRGIVQQAVAPLHSSAQLSQRASKLQQDGKLSSQDAQTVQSEMDRAMAAEPQWRGHQDLLFDRVVGNLALEGKIQIMQQGAPGSGNYGAPPGSPIHAAGGGAPPGSRPSSQQGNTDGELAEIKRMFSRTLGNVPIAKLREFHAQDPSGGQKQQVVDKNGQVQMVESSTLRGSYEHRR